MPKVRVKANEDFFDLGNYQQRAKGSEFILKDTYAKTLKDKVSVLGTIKSLKAEAVPKKTAAPKKAGKAQDMSMKNIKGKK